MIETRSLCAGYHGKKVLTGADIILRRGQITVITGPNGCGKSTLLKSIAGMLKPMSGSILVDARDASGIPHRELARYIAYLPQNRSTPDITALRLVVHGRFPYLTYPRRYSRKDLDIARDAMAKMGIAELEDTPLSALSGGTRQKVYIAMVLAQNAPVVLFDEPTTFLDASHQLQMLEHARTLASQNKAVAMVLHDVSMALRYADSLAVMQSGRVAMQATPEQIFNTHCLDRILNVRISKIETPDGPQYYYTSQKEQ